MKKWTVLLTSLLLVSLLAVILLPVHGEEDIYSSVVRLHVIANSDSEIDQSNKLQVRDAILNLTAPLLSDCENVEEAQELLTCHMEDIQSVAEETLASLGADQSVAISFGEETYPERSYDSFCFPGGTYLSMRVLIGDAEGKNWWCCLFPPLCLGAATASKETAEDAFISVGLTPSQYKIITESEEPVYKVRFKLLETFQTKKK